MSRHNVLIEYTVRVLYGAATWVEAGTQVRVEIKDNGHAWYRKNEREYLVYPGEYKEIL